MKKKFQEFQDYRRRGKRLVLLFCLDILFLSLAVTFSYQNFIYSGYLTIVFFILGFLSLCLTAISSRLNFKIIGKLEESFLNNTYGTSAIRIRQFHKLMEDNLFEYYFQPIINAKTGEIFAYEALMRTNSDTIGMLPYEILDLAEKENRLYEIEKFTFFNTLKIMKENSEVFITKKLFINSISSHQLSDEDFDKLYMDYGALFQNIVMEITESTHIDEDGVRLIQKRLQKTNCQLALDDYGTGYSNESKLLNSNPNYVKIDRTILRYINIDTKKQHLVSNLVNFASQNNIKIIAEGIETYEEFEYVIKLGVDYIQGFYTAIPNPFLINTMSEDIIEKLVEINSNHYLETATTKVYESNNDSLLSPVALALQMYSDIIINEKELILQGNHGMVANISLIIPDNHKCHITLDHVNLRGFEKPSITLGKNCSVILNLIGDNNLSYDGIRVPETSDLTILGTGNLSVQAERTNRVGIGGTASQSYGNIILASSGIIKVISSGNMSVAIGGGQNSFDSIIRLMSGTINVVTSGYDSVGIGNISGNARIEINDCKVKIKSEGRKTIGIGCMKGPVYINTSGDLNITCDGKTAVAIGSLDESDGTITINNGILNIRFNTHMGSGIGAINGKVNIEIFDGDININGEGTDIVGIGDPIGVGDIKIHNGMLSIQLFATIALPIGNIKRNIIIDGGNIQCDFPEDITPVNSCGTPLVARVITDIDKFSQAVKTFAYAYDYQAAYLNRYPHIKVYLPENIII
ncbi:MAG: EAL domain-containing protein [Mobilitalea sp.]